MKPNLWKVGVLAVGSSLLSAVLVVGAGAGIKTYDYLFSAIGTTAEGKPFTRADYLDALLARAAQAAPASAPAPAPPKAK